MFSSIYIAPQSNLMKTTNMSLKRTRELSQEFGHNLLRNDPLKTNDPLRVARQGRGWRVIALSESWSVRGDGPTTKGRNLVLPSFPTPSPSPFPIGCSPFNPVAIRCPSVIDIQRSELTGSRVKSRLSSLRPTTGRWSFIAIEAIVRPPDISIETDHTGHNDQWRKERVILFQGD